MSNEPNGKIGRPTMSEVSEAAKAAQETALSMFDSTADVVDLIMDSAGLQHVGGIPVHKQRHLTTSWAAAMAAARAIIKAYRSLLVETRQDEKAAQQRADKAHDRLIHKTEEKDKWEHQARSAQALPHISNEHEREMVAGELGV